MISIRGKILRDSSSLFSPILTKLNICFDDAYRKGSKAVSAVPLIVSPADTGDVLLQFLEVSSNMFIAHHASEIVFAIRSTYKLSKL